MAHFFLQAPASLSVMSALRWAQVLAISNDKKLAIEIANSYLGRNDFGDEDYWIHLIHMLSKAECFDYRIIPELVTYLRIYKQQNLEAQLKGRPLSSILQRLAEWCEEQLKLKKSGELTWETCGILPLSKTINENGQNNRYQIVELLSKNELYEEGKKMGHCVASYANSCYKGVCGIFSLRKVTTTNTITEATIEVNLKNMQVVQAKAKFNNAVSKKGMKQIHKWAYVNDLFVEKNL